MTATITERSKPADVSRVADRRQTAVELSERRLALAQAEDFARERMLTAIVEGEPTLDNFVPSRGELLMFEAAGLKSINDIRKALKRHACVLNLRHEVGNPAVLQAARERFAESLECERTIRGELSDIEVSDGAGPVLVRQIKQLQDKLGSLTAERLAAESEVKRIEQLLDQLRKSAPKWMQTQTSRELAMIGQSHPAKRRMIELRIHINELQKIVWRWLDQEHEDKANGYMPHHPSDDAIFPGYAAQHCKEAFEENSNGYGGRIDVRKFAEHVAWLQTHELPRLRQEQAVVTAEWQKVCDEVTRPIEAWVQHGIID